MTTAANLDALTTRTYRSAAGNSGKLNLPAGPLEVVWEREPTEEDKAEFAGWFQLVAGAGSDAVHHVAPKKEDAEKAEKGAEHHFGHEGHKEGAAPAQHRK